MEPVAHKSITHVIKDGVKTEENPYEKLKNNISDSVTDIQLGQLKQHFADAVASKRSLAKVKSVLDLFSLLETRDCLSEDNVTCLTGIASVINNSEVKNLIHTYKKLYETDPKPCICQVHSRRLQPIASQPTVRAELQTPDLGYRNDSQVFFEVNREPRSEESLTGELESAIIRLCQNIGKQWPVLVRELGLLERIISEIRENLNDDKEQAERALNIWKEEAGQQATLEALERALNSRLCKQKGLNSHLMYQSRISCS